MDTESSTNSCASSAAISSPSKSTADILYPAEGGIIAAANSWITLDTFENYKKLDAGPVKIEFQNSQFLVFDINVARHMLQEFRITAEAFGTSSESRASIRKCGAPFVLMPEQVVGKHRGVYLTLLLFIILSFGLAMVVRLKSNLEGISNEVKNIELPNFKSSLNDEEDLRKRAEIIAKGRKIKRLKREGLIKINHIFRVRRRDVDSVEVTASEVDETLKELSKIRESCPPKDIWYFPLCDARDDAYEKIERPPFPRSLNFRLRLNTFRELWRRGYYLTCGLKFGCDFLVYEAVPGKEHAKWLVKCVDSQDSLSSLDLIALSRLSSQAEGFLSLMCLALLQLFYSFFKSLVGKDVVVELKNDLSICGTLHSVDQYLNMKLTDISVTDSERHPHMLSVKNCFVRGSVVRYVQLPSDQVDTQLLQDASRKEIMQAKRSANA
ncbi:unnamed protein product [Thelazia callipaeda]|uniref:U6 snRNA-associated Sm-like protein LSm2 n=1 Tax=Thelazia callipaeda TaxID=103827 RepID=A0A0N5CUE1_THECL|nr:unnamed protein product [Thelazia callipaeda]